MIFAAMLASCNDQLGVGPSLPGRPSYNFSDLLDGEDGSNGIVPMPTPFVDSARMKNGPELSVDWRCDEELTSAFSAALSAAEEELADLGSPGADANPDAQSGSALSTQFMPGRLLVKFKPGGEEAGDRLLKAAGACASGEIHHF